MQALEHADALVLARYQKDGQPMVMVDDKIAKIGLEGPQWIQDELVYTKIGDGPTGRIEVQSWQFVVPNTNQGNDPWFFPVGMHCRDFARHPQTASADPCLLCIGRERVCCAVGAGAKEQVPVHNGSATIWASEHLGGLATHPFARFHATRDWLGARPLAVDCKLFSPARAMEWIYLDYLRGVRGL